MRQPVHFLIFLFLTGYSLVSQAQTHKRRLTVTADHRYLRYEDGNPFFWTGDTGWEILGKLTLDEMALYLDNRAAKGFNVIQVMNLSQHDMVRGNRYGQLPFMGDPLHPNEKYYAILDSLVKMTWERDMIVALVVSWGDKNLIAKDAPPLFDSTSAFRYGQWIGKRYKDFPNMVWVMGGDRAADKDGEDHRPVWRGLANGIIAATAHHCLITYHPPGERSSSQWVHNEPWLDFNMIQSSHGRKDAPTWEMVRKDWSLMPVKPTLDSEPNYEDHPVNPWPQWKVEYGYFRDLDVRKQLYRSVFAGGAGVTYGHHSLWQFLSDREEVLNFADRGWRNALDRPGAFQTGYLRRLMESRPQKGRQPDESIIAEGQGEKGERMEAFRGGDNSYCMVYLPVSKRVGIRTDFFKGKEVVAWWYNPKDGSVQKVGVLKRSALMRFAPPTDTEQDWVLVVDDISYRFMDPGK